MNHDDTQEIPDNSVDRPERTSSHEVEQVLKQRAANLAQIIEGGRSTAPLEDTLEVIVFGVAGERYALETGYVMQVCPMGALTPLPATPDFVVGIMLFRGEVLSVVDLRSLLNLPLSGLTDPSAIIVLRGEATEFGVLAEEILSVERYSIASIDRNFQAVSTHSYIQGIALDRTAILDANQLLGDPELIVDAS